MTLHRYGYCISRSGLDLVLAVLSCEPQMPTRSSRSTSDGRLQGIPASVFGRHALPVPPSCQCMISCGRRIAGAAQQGDMSSRPTINTLWGPFAVSSIFSRCRGTVVTIWRVFCQRSCRPFVHMLHSYKLRARVCMMPSQLPPTSLTANLLPMLDCRRWDAASFFPIATAVSRLLYAWWQAHS